MTIGKIMIERIIIICRKDELSSAFDYCLEHAYDIKRSGPRSLENPDDLYRIVAERVQE